jgi:hypothetical protein
MADRARISVPRSSPACTRRRCASTSAGSARARPPAAGVAGIPTRTSSSCGASRSSPEGISLVGVQRILDSRPARSLQRVSQLQEKVGVTAQ